MSRPKHAEHPGDCKFLGIKGRFDLYFDPHGHSVPEVIARHGSGVNDFRCWPVDGGPRADVLQSVFSDAKELAIQQGLLD